MKPTSFSAVSIPISFLLFAAIFHQSLAATTLLVYNNNDTGAGSLRQAIADNRALGGGNTIVFSNIVTGTITLTASELVISNDVSIQGPGSKVLTLSGNNAHRIFNILNANVSISGFMIAFGKTNFDGGGGIKAFGATLTLNDCIVANNSTQAGTGGGVYAAGTMIATNCAFSTNTALGGVTGTYGGGVYVSGTLILVNCAIVQNQSIYGAGLSLGGSGTLINTTVYGNSGGGYGGGIYNYGTLTLSSCTITRNSVAADGGGINNQGTCSIRNTIVARNTNAYSGSWDCYGTFTSGGFNLIGAINGSGGWGALGDQTGFTNSPINPLLDVPGYNGGTTLTVRPLPGSPAIDQGKSFGLLTDQRGRTRPIDKPTVPNAPAGDASDIGALEISPGTLLVTNTNDTGPGSLRQAIAEASSFDGDSVLFDSNVVGTISLTTGVLPIDKDLTIRGPGASLLALDGRTNTQIFLVLAGNVSIFGLTLANGRYIGSSGNIEQDGFEARGGAIFNQASLALNDCIISNNAVTGGAGGPTASGFAGNGGNGKGGAVANIGTLSMTNCSILANSATGGTGGAASAGGFDGMGGQGYGAGIYSAGPLTVVRCAVAGNVATAGNGPGGAGSGSGGGLDNEGSATILSSTIASNQAAGSPFDFGGGIYDNGTALLLRSCTIAGNQADYGGGISSGGVDLGNTILAGNSAGSGPNCSGMINSSDYNLIQNTNGAGFTGIITHNIVGQDPLLGPLQNNGSLSPTMALPFNSPAIDKGRSFGLSTDQRNVQRPFDFPSIVNAGAGDGSDIGAFELGPPPLTVARLQSDVVLSWPSYYGPFVVQSVADVAASNSWATVPGTATILNNQYVLTNGPISGTKFYRLKSP